jgi:hypothetical protein
MAKSRTWRMRMFTDLSPGYTLEDENGVAIPDEDEDIDLTDRDIALMQTRLMSEIVMHLRTITSEQITEIDTHEAQR